MSVTLLKGVLLPVAVPSRKQLAMGGCTAHASLIQQMRCALQGQHLHVLVVVVVAWVSQVHSWAHPDALRLLGGHIYICYPPTQQAKDPKAICAVSLMQIMGAGDLRSNGTAALALLYKG